MKNSEIAQQISKIKNSENKKIKSIKNAKRVNWIPQSIFYYSGSRCLLTSRLVHDRIKTYNLQKGCTDCEFIANVIYPPEISNNNLEVYEEKNLNEYQNEIFSKNMLIDENQVISSNLEVSDVQNIKEKIDFSQKILPIQNEKVLNESEVFYQNNNEKIDFSQKILPIQNEKVLNESEAFYQNNNEKINFSQKILSIQNEKALDESQNFEFNNNERPILSQNTSFIAKEESNIKKEFIEKNNNERTNPLEFIDIFKENSSKVRFSVQNVSDPKKDLQDNFSEQINENFNCKREKTFSPNFQDSQKNSNSKYIAEIEMQSENLEINFDEITFKKSSGEYNNSIYQHKEFLSGLQNKNFQNESIFVHHPKSYHKKSITDIQKADISGKRRITFENFSEIKNNKNNVDARKKSSIVYGAGFNNHKKVISNREKNCSSLQSYFNSQIKNQNQTICNKYENNLTPEINMNEINEQNKNSVSRNNILNSLQANLNNSSLSHKKYVFVDEHEPINSTYRENYKENETYKNKNTQKSLYCSFLGNIYSEGLYKEPNSSFLGNQNINPMQDNIKTGIPLKNIEKFNCNYRKENPERITIKTNGRVSTPSKMNEKYLFAENHYLYNLPQEVNSHREIDGHQTMFSQVNKDFLKFHNETNNKERADRLKKSSQNEDVFHKNVRDMKSSYMSNDSLCLQKDNINHKDKNNIINLQKNTGYDSNNLISTVIYDSKHSISHQNIDRATLEGTNEFKNHKNLLDNNKTLVGSKLAFNSFDRLQNSPNYQEKFLLENQKTKYSDSKIYDRGFCYNDTKELDCPYQNTSQNKESNLINSDAVNKLNIKSDAKKPKTQKHTYDFQNYSLSQNAHKNLNMCKDEFDVLNSTYEQVHFKINHENDILNVNDNQAFFFEQQNVEKRQEDVKKGKQMSRERNTLNNYPIYPLKNENVYKYQPNFDEKPVLGSNFIKNFTKKNFLINHENLAYTKTKTRNRESNSSFQTIERDRGCIYLPKNGFSQEFLQKNFISNQKIINSNLNCHTSNLDDKNDYFVQKYLDDIKKVKYNCQLNKDKTQENYSNSFKKINKIMDVNPSICMNTNQYVDKHEINDHKSSQLSSSNNQKAKYTRIYQENVINSTNPSIQNNQNKESTKNTRKSDIDSKIAQKYVSDAESLKNISTILEYAKADLQILDNTNKTHKSKTNRLKSNFEGTYKRVQNINKIYDINHKDYNEKFKGGFYDFISDNIKKHIGTRNTSSENNFDISKNEIISHYESYRGNNSADSFHTKNKSFIPLRFHSQKNYSDSFYAESENLFIRQDQKHASFANNNNKNNFIQRKNDIAPVGTLCVSKNNNVKNLSFEPNPGTDHKNIDDNLISLVKNISNENDDFGKSRKEESNIQDSYPYNIEKNCVYSIPSVRNMCDDIEGVSKIEKSTIFSKEIYIENASKTKTNDKHKILQSEVRKSGQKINLGTLQKTNKNCSGVTIEQDLTRIKQPPEISMCLDKNFEPEKDIIDEKQESESTKTRKQVMESDFLIEKTTSFQSINLISDSFNKLKSNIPLESLMCENKKTENLFEEKSNQDYHNDDLQNEVLLLDSEFVQNEVQEKIETKNSFIEYLNQKSKTYVKNSNEKQNIIDSKNICKDTEKNNTNPCTVRLTNVECLAGSQKSNDVEEHKKSTIYEDQSLKTDLIDIILSKISKKSQMSLEPSDTPTLNKNLTNNIDSDQSVEIRTEDFFKINSENELGENHLTNTKNIFRASFNQKNIPVSDNSMENKFDLQTEVKDSHKIEDCNNKHTFVLAKSDPNLFHLADNSQKLTKRVNGVEKSHLEIIETPKIGISNERGFTLKDLNVNEQIITVDDKLTRTSTHIDQNLCHNSNLDSNIKHNIEKMLEKPRSASLQSKGFQYSNHYKRNFLSENDRSFFLSEVEFLCNESSKTEQIKENSAILALKNKKDLECFEFKNTKNSLDLKENQSEPLKKDFQETEKSASILLKFYKTIKDFNFSDFWYGKEENLPKNDSKNNSKNTFFLSEPDYTSKKEGFSKRKFPNLSKNTKNSRNKTQNITTNMSKDNILTDQSSENRIISENINNEQNSHKSLFVENENMSIKDNSRKVEKIQEELCEIKDITKEVHLNHSFLDQLSNSSSSKITKNTENVRNTNIIKDLKGSLSDYREKESELAKITVRSDKYRETNEEESINMKNNNQISFINENTNVLSDKLLTKDCKINENDSDIDLKAKLNNSLIQRNDLSSKSISEDEELFIKDKKIGVTTTQILSCLLEASEDSLKTDSSTDKITDQSIENSLEKSKEKNIDEEKYMKLLPCFPEKEVQEILVKKHNSPIRMDINAFVNEQESEIKSFPVNRIQISKKGGSGDLIERKYDIQSNQNDNMLHFTPINYEIVHDELKINPEIDYSAENKLNSCFDTHSLTNLHATVKNNTPENTDPINIQFSKIHENENFSKITKNNDVGPNKHDSDAISNKKIVTGEKKTHKTTEVKSEQNIIISKLENYVDIQNDESVIKNQQNPQTLVKNNFQISSKNFKNIDFINENNITSLKLKNMVDPIMLSQEFKPEKEIKLQNEHDVFEENENFLSGDLDSFHEEESNTIDKIQVSSKIICPNCKFSFNQSAFQTEKPKKIVLTQKLDHITAKTAMDKAIYTNKRRKKIPWTDEETKNLIEGKETHGLSWAQILKNYTFNPVRTNTDLKDKYRIITKTSSYYKQSIRKFVYIDENDQVVKMNGEVRIYSDRTHSNVATRIAKEFNLSFGTVFKVSDIDNPNIIHVFTVATFEDELPVTRIIKIINKSFESKR